MKYESIWSLQGKLSKGEWLSGLCCLLKLQSMTLNLIGMLSLAIYLLFEYPIDNRQIETDRVRENHES